MSLTPGQPADWGATTRLRGQPPDWRATTRLGGNHPTGGQPRGIAPTGGGAERCLGGFTPDTFRWNHRNTRDSMGCLIGAPPGPQTAVRSEHARRHEPGEPSEGFEIPRWESVLPDGASPRRIRYPRWESVLPDGESAQRHMESHNSDCGSKPNHLAPPHQPSEGFEIPSLGARPAGRGNAQRHMESRNSDCGSKPNPLAPPHQPHEPSEGVEFPRWERVLPDGESPRRIRIPSLGERPTGRGKAAFGDVPEWGFRVWSLR